MTIGTVAFMRLRIADEIGQVLVLAKASSAWQS